LDKKNYFLYKIYYRSETGEDVLVYIGRTKQPLNARLRGHFFKAPMMREIDIWSVSKVEFAEFKTEADMFVMEIVLINHYKPPLNRDDKAKDELTIPFQEPHFTLYECPHIEKWKQEIARRDLIIRASQEKKNALVAEKAKKRCEIYSRTDLSADEKADIWTKWLVDYYEPAIEKLSFGG